MVKTVPSVDFAKAIGKMHKNVMRDIKTKGNSTLFQKSEYTHPHSKQPYPMYLITYEGCLSLGRLLRGDKAVKFQEFMKENFDTDTKVVVCRPDRKEDEFISQLSEVLLGMGLVIIPQYNIMGFRLDGYIPRLNLAIEYDEAHHTYRTKEDSKRERDIKRRLGCDFVRVSETDSHLNNIGVVLAKILEA